MGRPNGRAFSSSLSPHSSFSIFGPRVFCALLEWLPLETLFWETPRLVQRWAELLSLEAQDSDRSACQSSRVQAASSGIAVLSPTLFTLVTVQHLELTPGMSHYRQRSSQGKWPARLSEETNTLFTLPFISINSVSMPPRWRCLFKCICNQRCVCVCVCVCVSENRGSYYMNIMFLNYFKNTHIIYN